MSLELCLCIFFIHSVHKNQTKTSQNTEKRRPEPWWTGQNCLNIRCKQKPTQTHMNSWLLKVASGKYSSRCYGEPVCEQTHTHTHTRNHISRPSVETISTLVPQSFKHIIIWLTWPTQAQRLPLECVSGRGRQAAHTRQKPHTAPRWAGAKQQLQKWTFDKSTQREQVWGSAGRPPPQRQTTTLTFAVQTRRPARTVVPDTSCRHATSLPDLRRAVLEWNRGGGYASDLMCSIRKKPNESTDSEPGQNWKLQSSAF